MRCMLAVAAAWTLLFAAAKAGSAQGLWVNGHATFATGMEMREKSASGNFAWEAGPGLGLTLGWAFTPNLSVFLGGNGAVQADEDGRDWGIVQADLGVRYTFAPAGISPYVSAGIGARSFEYTENGGTVEVSGTMFSLGGGVQRFVSRRVALDAGATLGFGALDEISVSGTVWNDGSLKLENMANTTTRRVNLGVTWYPAIPR